MKNEPLPAQGPVDVNVSRIFQRTFARLNRLKSIRAKLELVAQKWHLLRLTNFGTTGEELALAYFGLAMEYERERYWFMKPIHPLISTANTQESMQKNATP